MAAGVVGRQPERVELGLADERVGQHLDETGAGEREADAAAQPLLAGQPATGRAGGQDGGHLGVADDPRDLLDQVVRVGQVGPPGRRQRRSGCRRPP